MLSNSKLDDKGTICIWVLVKVKHLLKLLKKVHLEEFISEAFILVLMAQKVMERI